MEKYYLKEIEEMKKNLFTWHNVGDDCIEIFVPIVGFEGYYVSNKGRVLSKKYGRDHILTPYDNGRGYLSVGLCAGGIRVQKLVHILVAEAFLAPKPEGCQVDHINSNKADNRVDNLQWLTPQENTEKAKGIPVKCIDTGIIYPSAAAAARAVNRDRSCITKAISKNGKCAGYKWAYAEED